MEANRITVTEALNELKLLDKRIKKTIDAGDYVGSAKKSSDKIGHMTKAEYEAKAKASLQSAMDLIARRDKIKAAIVYSNAITEVVVGNTTMTVAEAIELKTSIEYRRMLLEELVDQYDDARCDVANNNYRADQAVDRLREQYVGKTTEGKLDTEGFEVLAENYHKLNDYALVDPNNILDVITKMENEINDFESNVNTALVIKNATTFIEV